MFSLIIYGDGSQWSEPHPWRIDASRFLEHSSEEAVEFFKGRRNLAALESLPTIITGEWGSSTDQVVRFGFVRNVKQVGGSIVFHFDEQSHASQDLLDSFERELQLGNWEHSRSHWAVKDGDLPSELMGHWINGTFKEFPYEVVVSYASENIEYVEQVVELLREKDVRLFYAPDEQYDLWGKSLKKQLDAIYCNLGRFCLMFVSAHYARKAWPTFESKAAMRRALEQTHENREDYVLACRFDDTEVPGMPEDVVYQDLTINTPAQIAELVLNKLRRKKGMLRN